MAINQAYIFLIFALNGMFIGLVFDFFRILRRSFETINIITYVEDIIFWIITGISIIFCMYNFSGGSLRLFMFLGLCLGIVLYMLIFSNIIIKTFVYLITTIKKIISKFIKIIITPLRFCFKIIDKIILNPIHNISKKIIYRLKYIKR